MTARPQYLVEVGWSDDTPAWRPAPKIKPTADREVAIAAMSTVAALGGVGVYGPHGTKRLRVRAVTR